MKPIGKELRDALTEFNREWAPHAAALPNWQQALNKVVIAAMTEGATRFGDRLSEELE